MMRIPKITLTLLLGFSGAAIAQHDPAALEFFETKIRPILVNRCYECHGPDEQESDLRMDHISSMLTGGERGPSIVPGKPEESRLVAAIEYEDVDLQMPKKEMMDDDEIDLLIEWVRMGAPWPDEPVPESAPAIAAFDVASRRDSHWAWQDITSQAPPKVKQGKLAPTNIDRFLVAKLEENKLTPGGETDRRSLLRRIYFDLVGLPPTPEEIHEFLADNSPDAAEKVIERLLASPHFGERWGRHWLDLVRFAESYGHEGDYPIREAWRYRDYVIRAFNNDVPYDQLTREHIAGDLLPDPRKHPSDGYNESLIGTGWWYMHQATHAPVDVAKDEADRIDNQIDVLSKTFLGMTVSCARCHDHKFDAISTEDYYSLTAFLRSSRQEFAYDDPHGKIAAKLEQAQAAYAQATPGILEAAKQSADHAGNQVADYLLAAREVMHGKSRSSRSPYREDVFIDFEDGTYGDWTPEGAAFGDVPAEGGLGGQKGVGGFEGKFLINSFRKGDKTKGKLTSPEFKIKRPYIRFLIGGGNKAGKTCINLVVDGNVARTATGRNREQLYMQMWDVRDLEGKTARLVVVDEETGGWGHVNVDHIQFSENPMTGPVSQTAEKVAKKHKLDSDTLVRWVNLLFTPEMGKPNHPLHAWHTLANAKDDAFSEGKTKLTANVDGPPTDSVLFENFDDGFDDWFVSGTAFSDAATKSAAWEPNDAGGQLVPAGVVHSGLMGPKWQGMIRSPTFVIGHDSIHYRFKGTRGRVRLIIGRYELREYNGILFSNTYANVETGGEYTWFHQVGGIGKFKGKHAYIEIIDDSPNGYVAIDEIRFSNEKPNRNRLSHEWATRLSDASVTDHDALAHTYGEWAKDGIAAWPAGKLSAAQADWLAVLNRNRLLESDPLGESRSQANEQLAAISADLPAPVRVLSMTDGTAEPTHVFIRGNHTEKGRPVDRRWLAALAEEPTPIRSGSGRLQLAESILSEDNPLYARVMVNRVWHHLFGIGIVPSTDNFGVLGRAPSHPELLDYLATWFREDGYSMKRLIRKMMTTRAYRLSSTPSDQVAEEKDPANVWLHRAHVRRLEGEVIRDSLLAVAGQLNGEMYGPSVTAYLSPTMTYHRRPSKSGPMDGGLRRTIYLEVKRNFLPEMQLAFDFPLPDTTKGARTVSNLPAQSLILMNDLFVAEQAKAIGKQAAEDSGTIGERIERYHERALGRLPSEAERATLESFLAQQAVAYGGKAEDAATHVLAWSDLCQVLFMAKEFIFLG